MSKIVIVYGVANRNIPNELRCLEEAVGRLPGEGELEVIVVQGFATPAEVIAKMAEYRAVAVLSHGIPLYALQKLAADDVNVLTPIMAQDGVTCQEYGRLTAVSCDVARV